MDYLTLAEIARELKIPESTMRHRARVYDKFFHYHLEAGKKRYRESDIEVFKAIDECLRKGCDRNATATKLTRRFGNAGEASEVGGFPVAATPPQRSNEALPAILSHFTEVQNNLADILRQQTEINRKLEERIRTLEDRKGVWERLLDRIFGKKL